MNILVTFVQKKKNKINLQKNSSGEKLDSMRIYNSDFTQVLTSYTNNGDPLSDSGLLGSCVVNDKIYALGIRDVFEFDLELNLLNKRSNIGDWLHDIEYHDGKLYCVNSYEGLITVLDLDLNIVENIKTKFLQNGAQAAHINSIAFDSNNHPYIVSHNYDREGYVYKLNDDLAFPICRNLNKPHDIRFVDNGYLICDSSNNSIIYNGLPIESSWKTDVESFCRGLGVSENYYYVGSSKRETEDECEVLKIYKMNKKGRVEEIFNIDSLKTLGEIYSITVLQPSKYNSKFSK